MDQIPRDMVFEDEGRQKLLSGVEKLAKAVKSTMGAAGQTVLIESPNHTHGIRITKDGVTVAKDIHLDDPVENLAVQMVVDVASRTATSSGDGTTTSVVLTEALLKHGMKNIVAGDDKTEIIREMNETKDQVLSILKNMSRKLTVKKMKDVATISANNDAYIGGLVARAYKQAGRNAFVTVENSDSAETYIDVTNGIKLKRGYDTNVYVNDHEKDECVFTNPHILLTDQSIESFHTIEKILSHVVKANESLLIIGDVTTAMKNLLAANVRKNGVKICTITPPSFGWKQKEIMDDLALVLGTTFYSEQQGDNLTNITVGNLGRASKIKVSRDETVISLPENPNEDTTSSISQRIEELKKQKELTNKKAERDHIDERIALLDGGMAVIYAGGYSDVEQKELYDRIEDAVYAVRAALEEGYLPGGGVPFLRVHKLLKAMYEDEMETNRTPNSIAARIISEAIKEPFWQMLRNAHIAPDVIEDIEEAILDNDNKSFGFNVKTREFADLSKEGIIDPLKVTSNALENSISVATTILSTNAIVTLARAK